MSNKDFQNGFVIGLASGGMVEVDAAKPEQEKVVDITENGTTEIVPDEDNVLSKVTVNVDVQASGTTSYTNATYNNDNTITLIDTDDTEHTMACTYEEDRLISVTYDGKAIKLGYEGDVLKSVGKTVVDLFNAPMSKATTIRAMAEINGSIIADSSASLEV